MKRIFNRVCRLAVLAVFISQCIGGPVVTDPPVNRANCDVYGECSYKAPNQP